MLEKYFRRNYIQLSFCYILNKRDHPEAKDERKESKQIIIIINTSLKDKMSIYFYYLIMNTELR